MGRTGMLLPEPRSLCPLACDSFNSWGGGAYGSLMLHLVPLPPSPFPPVPLRPSLALGPGALLLGMLDQLLFDGQALTLTNEIHALAGGAARVHNVGEVRCRSHAYVSWCLSFEYVTGA